MPGDEKQSVESESGSELNGHGHSQQETPKPTGKSLKTDTTESSKSSESPPTKKALKKKKNGGMTELEATIDKLSRKLAYLEELYFQVRVDAITARDRALEAERRAVDAQIQVKAMERSTHSVQYMPLEDAMKDVDYGDLGDNQLVEEAELSVDALFNPFDEPLEKFEFHHDKKEEAETKT